MTITKIKTQETPVEELDQRGRKPNTLYEDAGYGSGENIIEAERRGVKLRGPIEVGVRPKEDMLTLAEFTITEDGKEVILCPEGQRPFSHQKGKDPQRTNALFNKEVCNRCKELSRCPVSQHKRHNKLSFTQKDLVIARRRVEQETVEFKEDYKIRSGIEATNSEPKRKHAMDKVWTRGNDRVTFAVIMKVTACNIKRFMRQMGRSPPRPQPGAPIASKVGDLRYCARQISF